MSQYDPVFGDIVHKSLVAKNLETPMVDYAPANLLYISERFREIMEALSLNLSDDSLKGTPARVAKMYTHEIFTGLDYSRFPKCTTVENKMNYDEMIAVEQIQVASMCEHHFLPFVGHAHIAYIPKGRVLGLSKFNRVVDFFSRRPQIQERLTEQVAYALMLILGTEDIGVVIQADHYCVRLRGIQDQSSTTVTSKMMGKFRQVPELRNEFLALTRK